MIRFITCCLLVVTATACQSDMDRVNTLKTGTWRGVLEIQGHELPFNFEVKRDEKGGYDIFLLNADERLLLDEVFVTEDSVDIALHIFDANLKASIAGDSLNGIFVNNYAEDYRIPFKAVYGQDFRFEQKDSAATAADFSGTFDVTFLHEGDTAKAVALFTQSGSKVTGTFMTPTGDYRFLEGSVTANRLQLSTFDGNHLYLFHGFMQADGSIAGEFFSGKSWHEQWIAVKDENATLPDPESLTYLKEGYDRISFTFPDVNGKPVSLDDERFDDKVVILQLLGTWCPNCMDETRFLSPWYDENKDRGVEIIGLAYERKDDFAYARERVNKMAEKMDVHYELLIAGTNDKEKAAATLPMLNAVVAFPTTVFIGKDGRVRKIHTGFNGPGTGKYYEQFKEQFNQTVNSLLQEDYTARK